MGARRDEISGSHSTPSPIGEALEDGELLRGLFLVPKDEKHLDAKSLDVGMRAVPSVSLLWETRTMRIRGASLRRNSCRRAVDRCGTASAFAVEHRSGILHAASCASTRVSLQHLQHLTLSEAPPTEILT
jgi:hypothetical protein